MAEPKQIGWLVSAEGAVVKYEPKAITLRAPADLYARARVALLYVDAFLKRCGWQCNCIAQSSTSLSFELGKISFDVSIRQPARIAYVTSRPGWEYRREVVGQTPDFTTPDGKVHKGQEIVRPTASVQIASDFIKDPWVIQIITTSENSSTPLYIPLQANMVDPAVTVAKTILLTLRNLLGADQFKIQVNEQDMARELAQSELFLELESAGSY